MFKPNLMTVCLAAVLSMPVYAEVSISGSVEMDLFVRTNQAVSNSTDLTEEIAIVINLDGKDKLDNGDTLKWRLAQKVATDYRYDGWGMREAWVGYQGGWGELRFGNQFSNSYLTLDWPYGSKAQNNMTADWGALAGAGNAPNNGGWGNTISYFSPDFSGVNVTAQYKIGAATKDTLTNGWDLGINASISTFNINLGFQQNNDEVIALMPVGSAGDADAATLVKSGPNAMTQMYFVGARAAFGDFSFKGLYKYNNWKGEGAKVTANQFLLGGSYAMGKNVFSLGWQTITDIEFAGMNDNSDVQQISGQWDYALSKNTGFFLQARYHMYEQDQQKNKFDGSSKPWVAGPDGLNMSGDTLRVLVGTWTGF